MLDSEDLKVIIKSLVFLRSDLGKTELLNYLFDVIDNGCRGYEVCSTELYEYFVKILSSRDFEGSKDVF